MEEEEQKRSIYQKLLIRNQSNLLIIRKYRRKCQNYPKPIQFINHPHTAHQSVHLHWRYLQELSFQQSVPPALQLESLTVPVRESAFEEVEKLDYGLSEVNQDVQEEVKPEINQKTYVKFPKILNSQADTAQTNNTNTNINQTPAPNDSFSNTERIQSPAARDQHRISLIARSVGQENRQKLSLTNRKALLNLQSITFRALPKPPQYEKHSYHRGNSKVLKIQAYRRDMDKIKERTHNFSKEGDSNLSIEVDGSAKKHQNILQNLKGLQKITPQQNSHTIQLQFDCFQNSILSPAPGRLGTNQPQQTPQSQKLQRPYMRRIRELRLNMHKCPKQSQPHSSSSQVISHMYSLSNSHMDSLDSTSPSSQYMGKHYQHSSLEMENLAIKQQAKMFRIQAIPLQQIKWM